MVKYINTRVHDRIEKAGQAERWFELKKEKKAEEIKEEVKEAAAPAEETEEPETEASTEEEPEERRGLFGAKKRERNDRMVLGLYTVAAVYLFYTAFVTAQELYEGKIPAGRDTIVSAIFVVLFGGTAVWLLYTCWKMKKALKQKEEEEAARLAEENGEEPPEQLSTGTKIKNLFASTPTMAPSVASRAAVYHNPADEDEEEETEEAEEEPSPESADGAGPAGEAEVSDEAEPVSEDPAEE